MVRFPKLFLSTLMKPIPTRSFFDSEIILTTWENPKASSTSANSDESLNKIQINTKIYEKHSNHHIFSKLNVYQICEITVEDFLSVCMFDCVLTPKFCSREKNLVQNIDPCH